MDADDAYPQNRPGNLWHLTTPEGQVVDAVVAPNHAEAALAFQYLLPRDGTWQGSQHGQYAYQTPGRIEVCRRAQRL